MDSKNLSLNPQFSSVFTQNEGCYHTFRIPSCVTTNSGVILAFAEARKSRQDVAENDLVLKRSFDGGLSWNPLQIVITDGQNSINNPTAVVLRESGRILLFAQNYPYPCKERTVQPGLDGPKVVRTIFVVSDDEGTTWSAPRDITPSVKRPTFVTSTATGPGIGIQLRRGTYKGRIVIPINQGPWGKWDVYVAYSDDLGKTWNMGDVAITPKRKRRANEVQVVELIDGQVQLNARSWGISHWWSKHCRKIAFSSTGGANWSVLQDEPQLIEPGCQASIFRYSDPLDGEKSRIIFSNPASTLRRIQGTIYLSYDETKTWSISKCLFPGNFAYSCLTRLKDGTIGCLFETGEGDGYETIKFGRFSLGWLTNGKDL